MKIVILGSRGMLGHDLMKTFQNQKPIGLDQDQINIADYNNVLTVLKNIKPTLLINAAAYTDVDGAEANQKLAFDINAEGVKNLVNFCCQQKVFFIHYSTDYIFSGENSLGYHEEDSGDQPTNIYGQSKLAGERFIFQQKDNFNFYLIRTSWLFGPDSHPHQHKNFVDTIINLSQSKPEISIVNDQEGKPTYTLDLAKATYLLMKNHQPRGVYHLVNEGVVSWYGFAQEIVRLIKSSTKVLPCVSQDFIRPACRPRHSVLLNKKTKPLRPWQEALKDYLSL